MSGGTASPAGDHRLAMAFAVSALGASGPCVINEMEAADVSFPGFYAFLRTMGAEVEIFS